MDEIIFSSEDEALQKLADITGKNIKVPQKRTASKKLINIFMERDDMTREEAEEVVKEMKELVEDGENPEDVLRDEGLEPDYIFELI